MVHTSTPSAGVGRRLGALAYDLMLLLSLMLVFSFVVLLAVTGLYGAESLMAREPERWSSGPLFQSALLCLAFAFQGGFWCHGGQTLGMRAWGIRVESVEGGHISWLQALQRFLAGLVGVVFLGFGLWWVWIDPQGRSWADRLSGSCTVRPNDR